jgi:hypothetical protein
MPDMVFSYPHPALYPFGAHIPKGEGNNEENKNSHGSAVAVEYTNVSYRYAGAIPGGVSSFVPTVILLKNMGRAPFLKIW